MNTETHHNTATHRNNAIHEAYAAGSVFWNHCDCSLPFPRLGIDLCGLKSFYAQRMARATCGRESVAWQRAVELLLEIEDDAQMAASAARSAVAAADEGKFDLAMRHVLEACRLEGKWHTEVGWKSLEQAIRAGLSESDQNVAGTSSADSG